MFVFSFFILLAINQDVYAQNKENLDVVIKSIQKIVGESTNGEKIKDSTTLYSYSIKNNILRKKHEQIVNAIHNMKSKSVFNFSNCYKYNNYYKSTRE